MKKRRSSAGKAWPVADPPPRIIDLLRRMSHYDDPAVMTPEARAELQQEIKTILSAWKARESVEELRELLGLKLKRGRRRTQRQVAFEFDIALQWARLKASGESEPMRAVLEGLPDVEPRTVQRAVENFGAIAQRMVDAAVSYLRQSNPDLLT